MACNGCNGMLAVMACLRTAVMACNGCNGMLAYWEEARNSPVCIMCMAKCTQHQSCHALEQNEKRGPLFAVAP